MKKTVLLLMACVMVGVGAMAQTRPERALYLNMGVGRGIANSYDNGTVPFFIPGVSNVQNSGATYEWKRFETNLEFRTINTALTNPSGTELNYNINYDLLYRVHDSKSGRWHQWVGGDIDALGDIRQIPNLQNASTNLSLMGSLGFVWKAECDFAYNGDKTHNWLTAYGKVNLPLAGVAYRPDFSYVGDGIGVTSTFDLLLGGHHAFVKFFPGCNTDLGLRLNFKNGNRIAFNYRWDFVTTGHKDVYNYVNAVHSFNATFMFNLFRQ
jgi:hypothetical protein